MRTNSNSPPLPRPGAGPPAGDRADNPPPPPAGECGLRSPSPSRLGQVGGEAPHPLLGRARPREDSSSAERTATRQRTGPHPADRGEASAPGTGAASAPGLAAPEPGPDPVWLRSLASIQRVTSLHGLASAQALLQHPSAPAAAQGIGTAMEALHVAVQSLETNKRSFDKHCFAVEQAIQGDDGDTGRNIPDQVAVVAYAALGFLRSIGDTRWPAPEAPPPWAADMA